MHMHCACVYMFVHVHVCVCECMCSDVVIRLPLRTKMYELNCKTQ